MTCVLGMIVRREREIRQFVKKPFYRVLASMTCEEATLEGEFRAVRGSAYYQSPKLYKENGFSRKEDAKELILELEQPKPVQAVVEKLERKKENKNPPLLYNLAELQNDCSKRYKISPDETLKIVQELYEKEAGDLSENGCPSSFYSSCKRDLQKYPGACFFCTGSDVCTGSTGRGCLEKDRFDTVCQ